MLLGVITAVKRGDFTVRMEQMHHPRGNARQPAQSLWRIQIAGPGASRNAA